VDSEGDVRRTETGIHLVGWLPESTDGRLIARRAAAAGIIARPVSSFRTGTIGRPGLVLGFAAVRPPEIRDAMQRLAAAFPPSGGARST
jgi:GntR family transcriptional regulator/MocR family aminotransferase